MLVVRKKGDIDRLPRTAKQVRVVCRFSLNLAVLLLKRCPNLKRVILTQTARKRSNKKALRYFMRRGIDLIYDYQKQGRPVKFSRRDLARMITMREKGFTYQEIASAIGVSERTVMRALKGKTKFIRWSEDYMGKGKVVWMVTRDADPDARRLADNHYSRKTRGAKCFCGPGEKLVLITPDKKALFVWRRNKIRWDGQKGVECSLFRNEGAGLSSELIREAVKLARKKWPNERLFTYVRPSAIRSRDPGFCFKRAGWRVVERPPSRRYKLILLEAP
ncbi:MAG: helix-turn-helix domain-containing protein [Candidatus Hadarchaeales archaeon]